MILPPPPRAWIDWNIPTDQHGREIGVANTTESYQFYLHWLADYLYETDIPVPACQQAMVEIIDDLATRMPWLRKLPGQQSCGYVW